jgi:hypothetical protein
MDRIGLALNLGKDDNGGYDRHADGEKSLCDPFDDMVQHGWLLREVDRTRDRLLRELARNKRNV